MRGVKRDERETGGREEFDNLGVKVEKKFGS